jgi:hypothetical protein
MAQTGNAPEGVDFSGLILGFSSAALYYMGLATVEGKPTPQKNLPLARQNIDILRLIQEKTKGNLTTEEATLLDQMVTDLQVKIVEVSK